MEDQPTVPLKLSLKEMALRKVVVHLWYDADILISIRNFEFVAFPRRNGDESVPSKAVIIGNVRGEWRETIEKIKAEISRLVLPDTLKEEMKNTVRPIGLSMLRWKRLFYRQCIGSSVDDLDTCIQQLCWTSAGDVDYKKTAEKLACLETLSNLRRFSFACYYCLEDYIPLLWEKLTEEEKRFYTHNIDPTINPLIGFIRGGMFFELYWAYILKGDDYKQDFIVPLAFLADGISLNELAFKQSVFRGNIVAMEYFVKKITTEEWNSCKNEVIIDLISNLNISREFSRDYPRENFIDVFDYLAILVENRNFNNLYSTRNYL